MNVDGSEKRQLTKHQAEDRAPAWSPDGKRIAFYSNRGGRDGIWVMNADGRNQKRLTDGNCPSWSPLGTHIAFFRLHDGLNPISRISVMDTNGQNVKFVVQGYDPSWSSNSYDVNPIRKLSTNWGQIKSQGGVK